MLWQEKPDNENFYVTDDVQDLSFKFTCAELPADHAWQLAGAIKLALPWIETEPGAAIHSIHGAASSNGWNRPTETDDNQLQLSKRTRFYLRLPNNRMSDALSLCGKTLHLGENQLQLGNAQPRKLFPSTTIFARSICSEHVENEETFTEEIVEVLTLRGIQVSKLLCGLSHTIRRPQGNLHARSVLLADLDIEQAIELQQHGLGSQFLLGCGIFLPHKSLAAVGTSQE